MDKTINDTGSTRSTIAMWVMIGSSIILLVLSLGVIIAASKEKAGDAAETVFKMVIPMLATWVGTVLAYYFSGENFEKANQSVRQMVQQLQDGKLAQIAVKDVMISRSLMEVVVLAQGDDGSKTNLFHDCIGRLREGVTRLPVLTADGLAKYIIHQSLLYKFVTQKTVELANTQQSFDVSKQTLRDFLTFNNMEREVSKSFAFISVNDSLAEAKNAMEKLAGCQDVFVTEDGTANKPVKGWLTNIEIAKYSKV